MDKELIQTTANYLYHAEKDKIEVQKITAERISGLTISEAYLIQDELINLREQDGHKVIAKKMGLTSKAKWEQMGVDSPIVGYLFDDMMETNNVIKISDYIHPKVEAEIGIVLKNDLHGPNVTIDDVLKNIDYVFSCVEVIDSRYQNFDFTLPDVIADNTSAKGAVFSNKKLSSDNIDLPTEEVTLKINGELQAEGNGAAVLGHPAEAVVFLTKFLSEKGESVKSGLPIMTGALTAASLIRAGDVIEVTYTNLDPIKIKVVE